MTDEGVHLHFFRPIHRLRPSTLNHRTHRKVMIVDEATGFTGGVGIADEWLGNARNQNEWRDTHFRIRGPAVDGLRSAFLDNWAETDQQLYDETIDRFPEQSKPGNCVVQCVRGASETGWSDIATLFRAVLQLAQDRLRITTAYFVPDDELTRRLCEARERGVSVQVLLPGPARGQAFRAGRCRSCVRAAARRRRRDLQLPTFHAAREGDDRGRCDVEHRVPQLQRPVNLAGRGSQSGRS